MAGLPQWVKQLAVRQLPPGMAERMAEEWQAHLDATPSVAQRTMVAAGFLIAAVRCELAAEIARSGESPLLIAHRCSLSFSCCLSCRSSLSCHY
jgi:hypothetical protein